MNGTAEMGITRRKTIAGFRITEFRQPPHRRLPWHEHRDASICFVLAGSYTEQDRDRERECVAHAMVFKPALERHANQFGRLGGRCLLIELDPARVAAIVPFSSITTTPNLVRTARLAAFGHQLHREFAEGDALSPLAVEGLVLEVLVEASRCGAGPAAGRAPRWLERARELIHDVSGDSLTLSSIASAVDVHPSHLARTFRRHFGRSIGDYTRCIRIERAAGELSNTDLPLAVIALRAGFFDQSHFSRTFRAHTGLTPGQFRTASRAGTARTSTHLQS